MADPKSDLTRRSVLTGAGVAVAAGVGLAVAPNAAGDDRERPVGTGPDGTTTVEFRGRISQTGKSGETFTSYGFLIRANGASAADLFAGSTTTVGSALFTAYATGELKARVLDQSVHSLDIDGELTVYQRTAPGATFDDQTSFTVGASVATYRLTLQDVLAVFAPQQGIPTLTGDMVQTEAHRLSGGLAGRSFGRRGQRLRFFATGLGQLVDPVTLNAHLEIAGNWSAE